MPPTSDPDGPPPEGGSEYERYAVPTAEAPDRDPLPPRFEVDVKKRRLAALLLKEFVDLGGDWDVVSDPPCIYGVFDGPVGGFSPREERCVGCLRCETQYPDVVSIRPHPERERLGDAHVTPDLVDTIRYEARTGQIPVSGQGYRGPFGGDGWDGMWTDMSEIVRPTRDGIHGREFISTVVDLGRRPERLTFEDGAPVGETPRTVSIALPILFDVPPTDVASPSLRRVLSRAAGTAETLAVQSAGEVPDDVDPSTIVPLIDPEDAADGLPPSVDDPPMVAVDGWAPAAVGTVRESAPDSVVAVRVTVGPDALDATAAAIDHGVDAVHLAADYHASGEAGQHVRDHVREIHTSLVERGVRDRVTLVGSGGFVAAEHVPKGILCGLDAVALDTAPLIALEGRLQGECTGRRTGSYELPTLDPDWAVQRLVNLLGSWRDQLLEVLGAMGMREVRRLRGEAGRAMFQADLERAAFGDIDGYDPGEPPKDDGPEASAAEDAAGGEEVSGDD